MVAVSALSPYGVITETGPPDWSAPLGRAGATAVICVSESTVKLGASSASSDGAPVASVISVSKSTLVAPVNPVPVIVTVFPPAIGPLFGEIDVIVGGSTKVIWSAAEVALVPSGVVTVTSVFPAKSPFWPKVAVISVSETTVKLSAGIEPKTGTGPKSTAVAPVNPDPVIVTEVLPTAAPVLGLTPVTTGAVAARALWPAT